MVEHRRRDVVTIRPSCLRRSLGYDVEAVTDRSYQPGRHGDGRIVTRRLLPGDDPTVLPRLA